jgi:hypothetical protein
MPHDDRKVSRATRLEHSGGHGVMIPSQDQLMPGIYIATSLLSLIEWWLDNNMKPAPAQMGKVYKSLIIDSTVGAVSSLSVTSR